MNKNAIKKYAIWARNELIDRVSKKALRYGISADGKADPKAESVDGKILTETERKQRAALIARIKAHGYEQTMEEVAYTWFNCFAALRFMEVNGYLPSHVRAFTNDAGEFKPQILAEAIHLDLPGLNMDKVYALKEADKTEELFRYLIIVQCNALSEILPGMFQRIEDFTELLLPDNLLREGSVIERLIAEIPEEDWRDQVQIIGWLYQYYNTEPKDKVFADLKKNIKVTKEKIPAATQLFTPDWIVRYMVENSLGRLWLEGHPNDTLKAEWKYYLDEAEQEPEVQKQLAEIRKECANIKPENIRCIDPCMGSGHILCYLFDVLMQIYQDYGHTPREAVASILQNNLYGLDIDDRAAQLAYFAVMMKARQYDRRFFSRHIQPKVMAIQESNELGGSYDYDMGDFLASEEHRETLNYLLKTFVDAKEYGSILQLENRDYVGLLKAWEETADATTPNFNMILWFAAVRDEIPKLIKQAIFMSQKYDVVVTNPPYMGSSNMSAKLSVFVKKKYPDSKNDLFACFIERCSEMSRADGYVAMITQHAWMFLSSFENLRKKLLKKDIVNMSHLGARAFEEIDGEVVQTTSMVFANVHIDGYKGIFLRLIEPTTQDGKEEMFLSGENRFSTCQENFAKIPGAPVAYWVNNFSIFAFKELKETHISGGRNKTHNNELYVRKWWEVQNTTERWIPYSNGGEYRLWYGDFYDLVDWSKVAKEFYESHGGLCNEKFWNKDGLTWGAITSNKNSYRVKPAAFIYSSASPTIFNESFSFDYGVLGYLNSCVAYYISNIENPTFNQNVNDTLQLPYNDICADSVAETVKENISLSKTDWDSRETSWDFERHPLVRKTLSRSHWGNDGDITIEHVYKFVKQDFNERFTTLKQNEEELNRIFIDIYGLQGELTPEVADKDVTVARIYDTKEEITESMKGNNYVQTKADVIKSLISYAVGCMMGRYSLDKQGLAYAGGEWDDSKYKTFLPDSDAILPICDDEYFDDDIVGRFVEFVKVVYGADTLEENLQFIADALGGRGTPREVIRNYFLTGFYTDHVKTYQKRPIYWLFDSGKKNGFKCLVYMHRYRPDTIARIRTDYVHEQQSRYRTAIESLENGKDNAATAAERVKLGKKLAAMEAQAKELREYEEKIHHLADQMIAIDLDDGVKHNYAIFKDVLAKIK